MFSYQSNELAIFPPNYAFFFTYNFGGIRWDPIQIVVGRIGNCRKRSYGWPGFVSLWVSDSSFLSYKLKGREWFGSWQKWRKGILGYRTWLLVRLLCNNDASLLLWICWVHINQSTKASDINHMPGMMLFFSCWHLGLFCIFHMYLTVSFASLFTYQKKKKKIMFGYDATPILVYTHAYQVWVHVTQFWDLGGHFSYQNFQFFLFWILRHEE